MSVSPAIPLFRPSPHGDPIALPTRPIHMTLDISSEHILVAFSNPSGLRVYRINVDATPGAEVVQPETVDPGIYAHQVRVRLDNGSVILVTRGHDAAPGKPEEPGALKVFAYRQGLLTNDTESLAAGQGCYAAWLTPQGRMLCDMHVIESGDMILLDVPAADVAQIADRFQWGLVNVNLRPYYSEGSKTHGFEIAEQLGWRLPDNVVVPMAGGSLIRKIAKAFRELLTRAMCRQALVASDACTPAESP